MNLFVLFLLFSFLAFFYLYLTVMRPNRWSWRHVAVGAVLLCLGLASLGATFRYRWPLDSLARIIPLPEGARGVYAPPPEEQARVLQELATLASKPPAAIRQDASAIPPLTSQVLSRFRPTYWLVKTPLATLAVLEFYRDATHRNAWQIVEQSDVHITLRMQNVYLLIICDQAPARPGTIVTYSLSAAPAHAAGSPHESPPR